MADKSTIIQNAQKYTAKGQIDKAIEEWQKLIAETPNDGNIYNTIGDLYLKNNSSAEAIDAYLKAAEAYNKAGFALKTIAVYKKVIKIDPQHMDAYVKLADLHAERGLTGNAIEDYMKVAKHYAKGGKVKESLEIYRKIANLDPANVNIQIKLAELCLKEGLKPEALDGLVKAAQYCSSQGKAKEAETLYTRILQIDPQNQIARSQVREASVSGIKAPAAPAAPAVETSSGSQSGVSLDQEEKSLRNALKKPEATTAQRQQLGEMLLKRGDLEGALHEFQQVVTEYHQDQQWGSAIQVLQTYLQKDPKRIEAHELLAQSYEKSGLTDRAVEEYVIVIDLMIREEHSMTEAMELFQRIKELAPQDPMIEKLKVRLSPYTESASKTSPSLKERSQASEKSLSGAGTGSSGSGGKEKIQSYLTEAEVYLKYGLSGKALEQLQTAVKIAPDNPEVHLSLKEVYKLDGKISEAIEECIYLAKIYTQSKQPELKTQILEEALALDPQNDQVKLLLNPDAAGAAAIAKEKSRSELSRSRKPVEQPHREYSKSQKPADNLASKSLSAKESTILREVEEKFAEAEFYLQQGLKEEAKQLYEKVLALKPDHAKAQTRLSELQPQQAKPSVSPEPAKEASKPARPKAKKTQMPSHEEGDIVLSEMLGDELEEKKAAQAEEVAAVGKEALDPAQQELESLFREFKKGVQEQFGDEDYETRYNLGIAYKEMGLQKEAIEEFKLASKGQAMFIDATSMIAFCYKEQGDYEHAARHLQMALKDERCSGGHAIGLKYELAQLYEAMDRKEGALDLYQEIYKTDKDFKDVARRIKDLKQAAPAAAAKNLKEMKEAAPVLASAGAPAGREYTSQEKAAKKKKVSYL